MTINITLILLIWNGAQFVYEGTLTQGQIVALVNYLLAILVELTKLVMQTIRLNRGSGSVLDVWQPFWITNLKVMHLVMWLQEIIRQKRNRLIV